MITDLIKDNPTIKYPCLGIFEESGNIVLFFSEQEGVCVFPQKQIGYYSKTWNTNWKLLGKDKHIILSN